MIFKTRILLVMSRLFSFLIAAAGIFSCSAAAINDSYSVTVKFTPDEDGLLLYMVNYDNGAKIDSAVVTDGVAKLSGQVGQPVMAQLVLDGNRAGSFILEPGSTEVDTNTRKIAASGQMNATWDKYNAQLEEISKQYKAVYDSSDADKKEKLAAIETRYNALSDSMFKANADNVIGYRLFLDKAYELNPAQFESALVSYPAMANFNRIKKLRTSKANEAATSEGSYFKDFTITGENGSQQKLSDFVGNGTPCLVDFWASWCGPCIRETETIKKLYDKYNGKGLNFLGVAVWDEPQNTQKAIEKHQLPWPMIINAQTIPTDIYGIAGIPCIILFDGTGKIVSRGKQGADLVNAVDAAMEATNAE